MRLRKSEQLARPGLEGKGCPGILPSTLWGFSTARAPQHGNLPLVSSSVPEGQGQGRDSLGEV